MPQKQRAQSLQGCMFYSSGGASRVKQGAHIVGRQLGAAREQLCFRRACAPGQFL